MSDVFAARPRNVQHYRATRQVPSLADVMEPLEPTEGPRPTDRRSSLAPVAVTPPADLVEAVARAIDTYFGPDRVAPDWSWQDWLGEARAAIAAVRAWDAAHMCVACNEPHAEIGAAFGPGCHP